MAQAYATTGDVETAYPELAGLVTSWHVELAKQFIDLKRWGTKASFAHTAAAAHMAGVATGNGGAVSSLSAGGISASFTVPQSDEEWSATKYGRQFLMLKKSLFIPGLVSGG